MFSTTMRIALCSQAATILPASRKCSKPMAVSIPSADLMNTRNEALSSTRVCRLCTVVMPISPIRAIVRSWKLRLCIMAWRRASIFAMFSPTVPAEHVNQVAMVGEEKRSERGESALGKTRRHKSESKWLVRKPELSEPNVTSHHIASHHIESRNCTSGGSTSSSPLEHPKSV